MAARLNNLAALLETTNRLAEAEPRAAPSRSTKRPTAPTIQVWHGTSIISRVPALLIQGAEDQYGTLKQIRAIEARSPAPVTSLILEACRHAPQVDQPQATIEAIVRFCAEVAKA